MRKPARILGPLLVAFLLAAPMAAAQEAEDNDTGDVFVDVRDDRNDEPEEAVGMGMTTIVLLVVLAVVVIALIVAIANRRP